MKQNPQILCIALLFSSFFMTSAEAETLTLTNADGREIQAELLSLEDDEVTIKMRQRGTFQLKLDQLSEESQNLVLEKLSPEPEGPESPGVLVLAEELVIEDALNSADWSENWRGGKGDFYAKEDHVIGVEDPSENHSAGAGRRQEMTTAIVQVEFRYDESTAMGIVIDFKADTDNKYDNQHVMKVQIQDGKFSLWGGTGWSDQTRRTIVGTPKEVEIVEGWNTIVLEFHEQEMVGHLNGEVVCLGSTEEPITAPKNQITLTAFGQVSYRHLKMWSGSEAHPEWEKARSRLERSLN
ncbi:MAG: family 16 glycoside hydrolase [Verrucomicrobiota bacterium]